MKRVVAFTCLAWMLTAACSDQHNLNRTDDYDILRDFTQTLTNAELHDDLNTFLSLYDTAAIAMPEFQPTLVGVKSIRHYYGQIFQRQNIKTLTRTPDEFITIDSTVFELGTFHKQFTDPTKDSVVTQDGKYCHIWKKQPAGDFKLAIETFGFFHPVDHPETLVVRELMNANAEAYNDEAMPFELRAYNALMEKYVSRSGTGGIRAQFFTDDGKFYPFAHATLNGLNEIKPYLTQYDTHGPGFKFDTIAVWTFRYEYHEPYVLEYPRFFVRWSAPGAQGGASGQGIRLWKRQPDHTLKLYREIGTHNLE